MDMPPQQSNIPFSEMELNKHSAFYGKKEDGEVKKMNILSLIQKSRVKIFTRKLNQVKYTSVNYVIMKVNINIVSVLMRIQFI